MTKRRLSSAGKDAKKQHPKRPKMTPGKKVNERETTVKQLTVIVAHSSGHYPQCGNHPVVQRWVKALAPLGTVSTVDFPKPFNLMSRLVEAYVKVLEPAAKRGQVLLVGLGMGGRVAAHLLSGLAGDDGKALVKLPSDKAKKSVVACIFLGYPLLRVGTREVRDAPLRAALPPSLFVNGRDDKHMDVAKLRAALRSGTSQVVNVEGNSENPGDEVLASVVQRARALCAAK